MTIAKPSYDELSPDLRYKIWERQNRGAIAKAGFVKAVGAIVGKAYWIALTPFVLFVAVPQVNDTVMSAAFIKSIWDLNPLGRSGKVDLAELDADQKAVAQEVIAAGKELGASERDIKIALMTAQQESGMRELNHGDDWYFAQTGEGKSDSVGVFQQRDSWGDRSCRIDARCSAKLFYTALLKDSQRNSKAEWEAAATVQRPAKQYEQHYQQWDGLSDRILKSATQTASKKTFPIAGQTWDSAQKTSPYGDRIHPITGAKSKHFGQDLAAPEGTPIVAVEDGTISDTKTSTTGCGTELTLTIQDGTGFRYCHLSKVNVTIGQKVNAGEAIGEVGNTGGSTAPHLHFELIEGGASVDPVSYLGKM